MKTSIKNQVLPLAKMITMVMTIAFILALLQSCEDASDDIVIDESNGNNTEDSISDQTNENALIDFDYLTVNDTAVISDTTVYYYGNSVSNLKVKLYQSTANSDTERPLILLGAGGAYKEYNQASQIQAICVSLAKRGYVAGYYEYSLGDMTGATWLKSTHDLMVAIRYFKKYASEFKIDPDNIFSGGWSTGGQVSMYAAYMSQEDFENVDQDILHTMLDREIQSKGFYPQEYSEFDISVKGTVLLMPYVWDLDIFQAGESAVMMICNENSSFSDGTRLWNTVTVNGVTNHGPNLMNEKFKSLGYEEGKNLEFIMTDSSLDSKWSYLNYTPLDQMYFDNIAGFLHRNMD